VNGGAPTGRPPTGTGALPTRSEVLALYRDAPAPARAHVALRWLTCPFPAVAAAVPPTGSVLEVGCGHGLLSNYLALGGPGRLVTGIDPDPARIAVARRAGARVGGRGGGVSFAVGPPGVLPAGPYAAVVLVDVVYLIEPAEQEQAVRSCAGLVAPGGALVLKETATGPGWRSRLTLAQETVAVRLLRVTTGARPAFVPPARLAGWMAAAGLEVTERDLSAGYVHPHRLLVGRRP
jgi:2-polyprenyl-3-methyl-5-hydroxy-6-metoxy-1,4-benzoquinol methylase